MNRPFPTRTASTVSPLHSQTPTPRLGAPTPITGHDAHEADALARHEEAGAWKSGRQLANFWTRHVREMREASDG